MLSLSTRVYSSRSLYPERRTGAVIAAFEENSAGRGGAVYCSPFVQATLLSQSTLSKNFAWIGGGGIAAVEGNVFVLLDGAVLYQNEASFEGGAIIAAGSIVQLQGETKLEGNRARNSNGGAVHVSARCMLSVRDSVSITENKAPGLGGGIYASASMVEIDGHSRFEANVAITGGAVAVDDGQVSVGGNSHFLYNVAMDSAGAVGATRSELRVNGQARFSVNHAYEAGGAIGAMLSLVVITDRVQFERNQAMHYGDSFGGAVALLGSQALIEGQVLFKSNRASSGGAIVTYTAVLAMTGVTFEGNWARERAGAAWFVQGSAVEIRDCGFESNVAWSVREQYRGGAIVVESSSKLEVWHTTFHDHACERGGTIYARLAELVALDHVTITKSYAVEGGGCIFSDATDLEISNSKLSDCNGAWDDFVYHEVRRTNDQIGERRGGAIFVLSSQFSMYRSQVFNSNAEIGGAICIQNWADASIVDSTISNNRALSGGAVARFDSGSMLLRDARIIGNVAREGNGGGLLLQGVAEVVLEGHNVIEFNSAAAEGGGIFSVVPLVMPDLGVASVAEGGFAKTVVSHNSAGSSGGGISTHGVMHMGLEHAIEYRNNSAQLDGGALMLQSGARAERVANCACPKEFNEDTFCTPSCQSAHCNWDDSWCHNPFKDSAGQLALQSCTSTVDHCDWSNMRPDCDFNRGKCQAQYTCPMAAAMYLSVYLGTAGQIDRPSWDPKPHFPESEYPLTWARGGEVGFGRCITTMAGCTPASLASTAIFAGIPGRVGATAVTLLRGSEWLYVPSTSTLQTQHTDLTVEAWVNVPSTAPEMMTLIASETMALQIHLSNPTNASITLTVGAFLAESCCIELEQWQHVSVVLEGGFPVQVYIDGHLAQTKSSGLLDAAPAPAGPVWGMALGRVTPGTPDPGKYFHGHFDEIRLWASAREQAQVVSDMERSCGDLALADSSLLLCYGFEGSPQPHTIVDEAFSHLQADGSPAQAIDGQQHASWCTTNFENKWGFCTDRPWLPGTGFDYDKDYLLNLTTMTTVDLFAAHPECGLVLNLFSGNTAKRNGGAIAKNWCSSEDEPLCFIDGFNAEHPDHSMSYFAANTAGRAGGAVFEQCPNFAKPCQFNKRRNLAIPWYRNNMAHVNKVQFVRNRATGYGNDIATLPNEVKIFGMDNDVRVLELMELQPYVCRRNHGYSFLDSCHSDELVVRDAWTGVLQYTFGDSHDVETKVILAPYDAHQVTITFEQLEGIDCYGGDEIIIYECSTTRCDDIERKEMARFCSNVVTWSDGDITEGVNRPEFSSRTGIMMIVLETHWVRRRRSFHSRWVSHILPQKLHMLPQRVYIPGEEPLNVTLLVIDGRGQRVQEGNELVQPTAIAASVCATDEGCGLFSPVSLNSFLYSSTAQVDGHISTLDANDHIVCATGTETVSQAASNESAGHSSVVRFQLGTDTSSVLAFATVTFACAPCSEGSTRVEEEAGWQCMRCDSLAGNDFYSATPNKLGAAGPSFNCLRCPDGAVCSEGQFRGGKVQDSIWELDSDQGFYVLKSCPTGYEVTSFSGAGGLFDQSSQQCSPCLAGFECIAESCKKCTACQPGYYKAYVGVDDCEACPANTYRTESGATELAACLPCQTKATTRGLTGQSRRDACVCDDDHYPEVGKVEPSCVKCPKSAQCEDGFCLLREDGDTNVTCSDGRGLVGEWQVDVDTGRYVLMSCPRGTEMVTTEEAGSEELQGCQACSWELEYILDPNTDACQKCPPGLKCFGTDVVEPVVENSVWAVNGSVYELVSCPFGYAVAPSSFVDFDATIQRCEPCGRGEECTSEVCEVCSLCQPGFYKSFTGTSQCEACPIDTFRAELGATEVGLCEKCPPETTTWENNGQESIAACKCRKDYYRNGDECKECPENAQCDYNTSLETLIVNANFWRDSLSTPVLYPCYLDAEEKSTCRGSQRKSDWNSEERDTDVYCSPGHRGPLCAVCREPTQYFDKETAHCQECSSISTHGIVFLVIVAVLVLSYLAMLKFEAVGRTAHRIHAFLTRNTLQAKFKILISFYQAFNSLETVYGVRFHHSFRSWLRILTISNFSPEELSYLGPCLGSMQTRLAVSACWPWAAALLVSLVLWIHWFLSKRGASEPGSSMVAFYRSLSAFVFIFYLVLPSVSRSIFSAIQCEPFSSDESTGGKRSYLLADLDMECSSTPGSDFSKLQVYFGVYFALWLGLVPLCLMLILLWTRKAVLGQRTSQLARATSFLWQDYEADYSYWELVDLLRKLIITTLIIFVDIEYGSSRLLRLMLATIISATYLTILACTRPYKNSEDLYLACTSNLLLLCCFASGISIKLCEDRLWKDSCSNFFGLSGAYQTNVFVIILTVVMLVIALLFILVKTITTITAPTFRLVSSGREPNLELSAWCSFHGFISHAWSTGQDQTHTIVRQLQLLAPDLRVWLDVDNLSNVGMLEASVMNSEVFVIFLSRGYFRSANCRRELYTALAANKPIVVMIETDEAKGGWTVEELKQECTTCCVDQAPAAYPAFSGPAEVLQRLLIEDPVVWVRVRDFQNESLKCVVLRMLAQLPYYKRNPNELTLGLKVKGEIEPHGFSSPVTLFVCEANEGALRVAHELQQASVEVSGAVRLSVCQVRDTLTPETGGTMPPGKKVMLLYLNQHTFSDVNGTLVALAKSAMDERITIVLVHEQDPAKGGCAFRDVIQQTPNELQESPYHLFDSLAVPYFPSQEHCRVSKRIILRNMGAKPLHGTFEPRPLQAHAAAPSLQGGSENVASENVAKATEGVVIEVAAAADEPHVTQQPMYMHPILPFQPVQPHDQPPVPGMSSSFQDAALMQDASPQDSVMTPALQPLTMAPGDSPDANLANDPMCQSSLVYNNGQKKDARDVVL